MSVRAIAELVAACELVEGRDALEGALRRLGYHRVERAPTPLGVPEMAQVTVAAYLDVADAAALVAAGDGGQPGLPETEPPPAPSEPPFGADVVPLEASDVAPEPEIETPDGAVAEAFKAARKKTKKGGKP